MALTRRAAMAMFQPRLRGAMRVWCEATATTLHVEKVGLRAAKRWANRVVLAGWGIWHAFMHERRLLTRSLGAMRHRQSRRGFDSWAATCTELAERRHSGTVCARRMMNQSTSRAFDSWVDSSRARQALLARLASGLTRWQHQRLAAALASWYNLTLGARDGLRRALWSWRAGSLAAGWRKWRRATFTPPKAAIALGRVRLTARADQMVRSAFTRWSARYHGSVSAARYRLLDSWRQRAIAAGSRGGLLHLLNPDQRRQWPQAWCDFFQWRLTWRELPWWLHANGIEVPHSHDMLFATLKTGRVYLELLHRIDAGACNTYGFDPRDASDGWRDILRNFLDGAHARNLLGPRSPSFAIKEDGFDSAKDHMALLAALRMMMEAEDSVRWHRFVASLTPPRLSAARPPRFTQRHKDDDYSLCEPSRRGCNYVCLGCATPRILLHNLRCGQCGLLATVSTEEYFAALVDESASKPASRKVAGSGARQVGSLLDATRGAPLWRRPRPRGSPLPARSSAAASGDGGAALFDKTSSRAFGGTYDRTPPKTPPLLGDLVELKHDSQIIYARVAERRATSRPAPRAVWHAVFEK